MFYLYKALKQDGSEFNSMCEYIMHHNYYCITNISNAVVEHYEVSYQDWIEKCASVSSTTVTIVMQIIIYFILYLQLENYSLNLADKST